MSIEELRRFGANVNEGLARCMNNEAFYLRLVCMLEKDGSFAKLKAALAANDLDAAFEAAHAMKGVMANLEMTPVLRPVSEITECLRTRAQMDYAPMLAAIEAPYEALMAIIRG